VAISVVAIALIHSAAVATDGNTIHPTAAALLTRIEVRLTGSVARPVETLWRTGNKAREARLADKAEISAVLHDPAVWVIAAGSAIVEVLAIAAGSATGLAAAIVAVLVIVEA
jgi:hypothetical protein